jgi:hypothetical protein
MNNLKNIYISAILLLIIGGMLYYFLVFVPEQQRVQRITDETIKRDKAIQCLNDADAKFNTYINANCKYDNNGQCFVDNNIRKMFESERTNDRITCQKVWGL